MLENMRKMTLMNEGQIEPNLKMLVLQIDVADKIFDTDKTNFDTKNVKHSTTGNTPQSATKENVIFLLQKMIIQH